MPVRTTGELVAGRYRMSRRLGAGGMAAVFLATDCRLEREVAIKRLHADSPEDVERRFQREAKVGASLNHPNMVGVYDTLTDDEGVLIVMEYVPGHTLRDEIARGPIEPARAIELLLGIASALDHAHEAGVVHRDVKPANVLIDDGRGVVKLADLGIATAAERTRITMSGNVLGTAAYMPPERLDGRPGGPAVDVYALAAMAFEMLSGRKAIVGSTPLEIARRVATAPPPDLRELLPDAPETAADVLMRGLSKQPDERPASAGELVRALASAYAAKAEEDSRRPTAVVPEPEPEPAPPAPAPAPERASANGHSAPVSERTGAGSTTHARPNGRPAPSYAAVPAPAGGRAAGAPDTGPSSQTTAPRIHRGRRRPSWLAPVGMLAVAIAGLAALAIALASSGGGNGDQTAGDTASRSNGAEERSSGSGAGSGGAGAEGTDGSESAAPEKQPDSSGSAEAPGAAPTPAPGAGSTAAPDPSTPTGAVSAFYTNAANGKFDEAWGLATPTLRSQLVSYEAFVSQQRPLKSIEFPSLEVAEQTGGTATVSFRSIARLETKTDRCRGTIDVVQRGAGWMVDELHVAGCTPGPPS